MATVYKTPGVYIEEISKFPPSVAQVETAIPAFVGYTARAVVDGVDYHADNIITPVKIRSLPEYELFFGDAPDPTNIEIELNLNNSVKKAYVNGANLLYDSIRMFYANGGGNCYIVSVGVHIKSKADADKEKLIKGLDSLEKEDEPTILVIPESVNLQADGAGEVHSAMLRQCNKLQDRFAILDIVNGDRPISDSTNPIAAFRNNVGMNFLKYGAAYYPWIRTNLPFKIDYAAITGGKYKKGGSDIANIKTFFNSELVKGIEDVNSDIKAVSDLDLNSDIDITTKDDLENLAEKIFDYADDFFKLPLNDINSDDENSAKNLHKKVVAKDMGFHGLLKTFYDYNYFSEHSSAGTTWSIFIDSSAFNSNFTPLTFTDPTAGSDNDIYNSETTNAADAAPYFKTIADKLKKIVSDFKSELIEVRSTRTDTLREVDSVYRNIYDAIKAQGVVLPPSGAVAGAFAMVDEDRGVWKSPANVSFQAVKGPAINVTHEEQENLNVDPDAGKSVNAIRAFTGKGTLIWGARTLAGNDNEWRYVSVRRFFIMVEESVKKASSQFVFEANDANTWVKVRAMIENFLVLQWRAGALAGAKQDHAFYVRVGLGQTMTVQDILNGVMNVEIGLAVVRPAEFIILKFSHKMQES